MNYKKEHSEEESEVAKGGRMKKKMEIFNMNQIEPTILIWT
eukprot:CAMPEP_0185279086 /NCGR_PEP_ID=MMETSP1359-20130426/62668_1 /TAXON_ID=552665 /ORGANISM="Bigelowiella longifila, Strain CCMP242" /LENGTH=40 /DNA_ID= /DNA_START= /DNA_END= /DNA_ORIENTATION=